MVLVQVCLQLTLKKFHVLFNDFFTVFHLYCKRVCVEGWSTVSQTSLTKVSSLNVVKHVTHEFISHHLIYFVVAKNILGLTNSQYYPETK